MTQKKFLQIWRKNILDKYKVKVNPRAIRELDHIYEYIANEKLAPENAKRQVDRIKKGMKLAIIYTCVWSTFAMIASYTIGPQLVYMVTGSHKDVVIVNATNYLKFNTIFYYVPAVISIVRNVMQGIGDQITPLVSSGLEMVGKVVIAFTLVPLMGYAGVIVAEPIVWFIMVIPLLVQIIEHRN